ncbi:hypothetical protein RIF29_41668 [Crotalaria pallida]|uniref:Complex III subunit VI n=1 Tax=Crotalaria pallida TaxID=3830 RepID=A0AAN9HVJ5_CROPI
MTSKFGWLMVCCLGCHVTTGGCDGLVDPTGAGQFSPTPTPPSLFSNHHHHHHLTHPSHPAMADEEPIDQKKYLEESCKPKCVKPLLDYEACVKRIQGDESGSKHCTGQYFDYWSCVDKCVAPRLLPKLK